MTTTIDTCLEELTWYSNETDKNAQEQLVLLVKLVLDDIGKLNKLPPVTQRSLLRIIRLMAERQKKRQWLYLANTLNDIFKILY